MKKKKTQTKYGSVGGQALMEGIMMNGPEGKAKALRMPDGSISVRTWERGCGRTLACGTGSCAAAVCASMAGFTGRSVKVHLALG